MITMRLHRLHFNSRAWPLTFAINWPHSHRVSATSDIACDEEGGIAYSFLILRTIIKIVGSIRDGYLTVKRALQQASWNATALEARQCRIICLWGRLSFLPWASLALTFFCRRARLNSLPCLWRVLSSPTSLSGGSPRCSQGSGEQEIRTCPRSGSG